MPPLGCQPNIPAIEHFQVWIGWNCNIFLLISLFIIMISVFHKASSSMNSSVKNKRHLGSFLEIWQNFVTLKYLNLITVPASWTLPNEFCICDRNKVGSVDIALECACARDFSLHVDIPGHTQNFDMGRCVSLSPSSLSLSLSLSKNDERPRRDSLSGHEGEFRNSRV